VIEGAPTPASGFLSVGTRAAGFAVALRVITTIFAQPTLAASGQWQVLGALDWTPIVGLVSGLTMVAGSFLALRQKSAKRMVGCLVIYQSGFLLLGVLVLDQVGMAAILYNLALEVFALMGIFYVLSFFAEQQGSDRLEDLKGILLRAVPECICLVIFLLCLVGVPPAPGFIGKFTLIGAAVKHDWLPLAVVAILTMALSTVAIARLLFHLTGDLMTGESERTGGAAILHSTQRKIFLAVLFLPVVFFGIFAESVLDLAGKSLGFILW
jgi:NADH-quinone oxidoreductase subunit N